MLLCRHFQHILERKRPAGVSASSLSGAATVSGKASPPLSYVGGPSENRAPGHCTVKRLWILAERRISAQEAVGPDMRRVLKGVVAVRP